MKKLLTLFTLLLTVCSGAWADDTYYLQTPGASTPKLTGDFFTTAPLTMDATANYNEISYTKGLEFSSNTTSYGNNFSYPDRVVRYDCKTTETEIIIVAYNKHTTKAMNIYYGVIKEKALGYENEIGALTAIECAKNSQTTSNKITVSNTRPSSIYFTVGDRTNCTIVQIIATEKGTALPSVGTAGYTVNFNKGRVVARANSAVTLDNDLEVYPQANYQAGNNTYLQITTKNTHYVKFTVANPMVLNLTTSSTNKYNVSTTKGSDDNQVTPTANVAKANKLTAAGTYYINPQGSNVQITGLSFSAAPVISYNANGGSGSMSDTYFTIADNGFTAPAGQVFDGWKDGEGTDYTVGNDVEANVTLYAQWRTPVVKYHVTYDLNGGDGDTPTETDKEAGASFDLAATPTRSCYTFAGWLCSADDAVKAAGSSYTMTATNTTFTAQWTPKYATSLNFQAVVEAGTQASNPIATFLSNANMEHSTFSSSVWETGDAPSSEYVGFKLKDKGAYVKFLVKAGKEVTITLGNIAQTLELYKNGVKTNIAASTGAGVQTVVPAFTPAEDMLVELRTTNTGTVTLKKIIIDEPIEKFDVTYKANGSGEADVLNNVSKVDENMFTYAGHAFTGWNTKADGNGDDYAVGDDVTSELTLFAQWINTYTVEFDLQSHGSAIDAQEVAEGGKVTEPTAPTADGWVFGGWYEESTCENEFDFNTTINADKTLYAKWTEDVKVTFFSVGGWSSSTNSSDWSGKDNIDVEIEGLNITGGTASAVSIESSKTCATTGSGASMAYSLGFNSVALKISLTDNQLKAGDVITITSNASHNNAFIITNTNNRSSSVSATATSGVAEYVVSESDILNDMSTIYIWRLSSTVNIKTLTISRSAANVTVSNLGIEGEKDYATMYYGTVAMAVPAGVKAKTYKVVDGKLTVSRTYENGSIYDVIPAGEAVVLEADVDANTPYMFSVSSTTTEPDGDNLLRGTDVAQTINTAGYKYYKLAKNNAGTKVGFYYAVEDGVSITNGAHKAYLAVPTGSGEAKEYFVLGGEDETSSEATAISAVEIEIANGATLYNLAGQKVGKDYKGIIVVNGKKYVRK